MSRFLFSTMGSLGDLHPYIAIAKALMELGHEAVIATAEEYRETIEGAGVTFAPVRPSVAELGDRQALISTLFDVSKGPERLIRDVVMPYLRQAYDSLMAASAEADLLVSHTLSMTLPIVAERRGLPWAATLLAPMTFMSRYDPPLIASHPWLFRLRGLGPRFHGMAFRLFEHLIWGWEAPLRQLRKELGVSPLKHLALFEGQFSPHLNLALFDPVLADPQPDWPAGTAICGSPIYDGGAGDPDSLQELDRLLADGEAPIVFALGSSAVWIAGDFWEQAAEAASRLGRRAILITGPTKPRHLPSGVAAFAYLPYSRVFPRAAVVVHQAGIGTLAQAMRAGRPQLLTPVSFDQPDNARRAARLGIGCILPFRQSSPQRLADALESILRDQGQADAAQDVARELEEIDGAHRAAEALIGCLARSR